MPFSDKQIKAVLALPAPKRYSHFIKVAADRNSVWGLFSEGWALAATEANEQVFPLWPAKDYAEACALDQWAGYEARELSLEELFDVLLPSLEKQRIDLGLFYTPSNMGVISNINDFMDDLRTELAKIE